VATGATTVRRVLTLDAEASAASNAWKLYINGRFIYKGDTSTHTHRELIREWLWEPKGSSLEYI